MSHFIQRPLSSAIDAVRAISSGSTVTIGVVIQGSGGSSAAPWWTAHTSLGTTGLIGTVAVSSGAVLGAGSSANTLGSVALVAGTSGNIVGTVVNASGSTAAILGSVTLASGSTGFLMGAVAVSSGVILAAGSSANTLGSVTLAAGTSANTIGSAALVAGTSANTLGSVALIAGSSANTVGAVAQAAGSTALAPWYTIAAQGPGSASNYWTMNSVPFSSAGVARTSVSTTIDIAVIAANANRKDLVIANGSTTQVVALGLTTAAVTTALANVSVYLQPASQVRFGIGGDFPLYLGPIRGINLTSTTVAGGVFVSEFT